MSYTDLSAEFSFKDLLTHTLQDQLAENTAFNNFPSGTALVFFQASAPTDWTKVTDNTDACLRVVSGDGGGTGGSESIATPSHTHTGPAHTHDLADGGAGNSDGAASIGKAASGNFLVTLAGGGSLKAASWTTDSSAITSSAPSATLKFINVIVATKDSTPAYTNLTSAFFYRQLLTSIIMDQLADNMGANTLAAGTACAFFQAAAPTGWTKSVANNDALLRVVSGSGGGTGGTESIATPFHTHTIPHTHTLPDSGATGGSGLNIVKGASGNLLAQGAGSAVARATFVTDSAGGTIVATATVMKHVNMIICTKDA